MPGTSMPHPPLSVLDLALVTAGGNSAQALRGSTELARAADRLGYHRFWVAEHHNMPSVASTSPPVLMAHLAASTGRIRVGSGGVMLPNHAPLVVAEQFAALEALHPGRIDLGIGRAPGTDAATAAALRRTEEGPGAEDFPRDLLDLMGLLGDPRPDVRGEGALWERFRATPQATSTPQVLLLGSSGYSAQLAGLLGLAFVFAHHFDMGGTPEALELYRSSFRPSAALEAPHAIVTANVLLADTEEEAERQALPGRIMTYGIRTGRFEPMLDPEAAAAHPTAGAARALRTNRVVGTPSTALARLEELVSVTAAEELLVSTVAHSTEVRIASLELLTRAWAADAVAATQGA
jgi:luciferase family oxidoreductase group 1